MDKEKSRSYGLNLALEKLHRKDEDWVFGAASLKCEGEIPNDKIVNYLPDGEKQNIGQEKMDCASRAPVNVLETKLNFLYDKLPKGHQTFLKDYLNDNQIEISDRYIAIMSDTTPEGNSLIKPLDAIRKYGLIPKKMFPQVASFDEYYNPGKLTIPMMKQGKKFLEYFQINYERVLEGQFKTFNDLLVVGGYAWPQPEEGVYPRTEGTPNHAFIVWNPSFNAFDNYTDPEGGFMKKLAPDFDLTDFGYRLTITVKQKKSILETLLTLLEKLKKW